MADSAEQPLKGPKPSRFGDGLVPRIASALVLGPIVLAAVFFGGLWFDLLVLAAALVLAWEWAGLVGTGNQKRIVIALALAALLEIGVVLAGDLRWLIVVALGGFLFVYVVARMLSSEPKPLWLAMGAIYIGLPCAAFVWLRADADTGQAIVFWLFALVWSADTGAYAAGRLIGGPKLAPRISPKKTWAGFIGGVLSAGLIGCWVAWMFGAGATFALFGYSALLGGISQGGDLIESWVKRRFDVKDSSNIIPGHGGLLDRVDALLVAIAAAALGALAFGLNPFVAGSL
ncbi:MAG: phosphatidate cytidylyltransferase [Magnetovibrionaceae bacterium]